MSFAARLNNANKDPYETPTERLLKMTKLALSYAILALEAEGYEQEKAKNRLSFGKSIGPHTIVCRLADVDTVMYGKFTFTVTLDAEKFEVEHSCPVMTQGDILSAQDKLFYAIQTTLVEALETAKMAFARRSSQIGAFSVVLAALSAANTSER